MVTSNNTATPSSTSGSTQAVASFPLYIDAEAAVDFLSDSGFPVEHVSIVGRDIRVVESVTGRLTTGKAALAGAGGGAWLGLLLGLLLGLFLPGAVWLNVLVGGIAISAFWGAAFGFFTHWATRGRRDFSSTNHIEAARYDVLVDGWHAGDASRLLAGTRFAGVAR
ncbi:MAG: conserved rane protein [Glaciihabitans sp.]|nr:conserved rane protein [Glaciihabitans sp.]